MKKRIFKVIGSVTLLFGLITFVFSWKEQTHQNHLTRMALKLLEISTLNQEYSDEIWRRFPEFIMQGAHDEDFPLSDIPDFYSFWEYDFWRYGIRLNCRANNHYRHALSSVGLTGSPFVGLDDEDIDALSWAKTNGSFYSAEEFDDGKQWKNYGWPAKDLDNGNMSWEKAIDRYGYTDNEKELAYYTLGFILHLLQDMGCPEHVHDDPHGASGDTGFEMYVYREWASLMPVVRTLRPKEFQKIDDYFKNLSLIAYSINRFQGGIKDIEPNSHLAKMFQIEFSKAESKWKLKNHDGTEILEKKYEKSEYITNPEEAFDFEWNRKKYEDSPLWHKGHDTGEFWPTSMEMLDVKGSQKKDAEGFYYIELSGEVPGLGETRNLYPAAFLPTPLDTVKSQCKGWQISRLDGKTHLYAIIGKKIFPYIVEHSTGLIRHYFDIVNHPPFLKTVIISQNFVEKYNATWEDEVERIPGKERMSHVKSRKFTKKTELKFKPGKVVVVLSFSEPVHMPTVTIAGRSVTGLSSDFEDSGWSGFFEIPETGPDYENLQISIKAKDKNNHYSGTGGNLDRNPKSPAKRIVGSGDYRWRNYEGGEDSNHSIDVLREDLGDISREHHIVGTWDWYVGNKLFGYVVVAGGGSEGTMISFDPEGKMINSGNWLFKDNENKYILQWKIGKWKDTLSISKNGMLLVGKNHTGTQIEGRFRVEK